MDTFPLPRLPTSDSSRPGVLRHACSIRREAVRSNDRYPRATAALLRTSSFGEERLVRSASTEPEEYKEKKQRKWCETENAMR